MDGGKELAIDGLRGRPRPVEGPDRVQSPAAHENCRKKWTSVSTLGWLLRLWGGEVEWHLLWHRVKSRHCRRISPGRPLGSDTFISKFEATRGRRLRAARVGRPARAANRIRR